MKIISCAGYHATGSGVIDDLFREFDNVAQGGYEAETMILQQTDAISDLEYHLVENPNRLTTGIAIERFLRYAKDSRRMYVKIFGKEWMDLCQQYINAISKFQYQGYHYEQIIVRHPLARYLLLYYRAFNKIKPSFLKKPRWYDYFPQATEYHASIEEEEFLEKTKDFIDILISKIPSDDKTDFIMLDQLISPNNPERYLRYVRNDVKVIVVDRDPRDLFIHHEIHGDHALPKRDPYQFSEHYRDIRKIKGRIDHSKVMYVTFENMIYNYDEMVSKVIDFIGTTSEHHVAPQTHFIPSQSIKGTQMWKKYPQYNDAIKVIERELPEFLHNY